MLEHGCDLACGGLRWFVMVCGLFVMVCGGLSFGFGLSFFVMPSKIT